MHFDKEIIKSKKEGPRSMYGIFINPDDIDPFLYD